MSTSLLPGLIPPAIHCRVKQNEMSNTARRTCSNTDHTFQRRVGNEFDISAPCTPHLASGLERGKGIFIHPDVIEKSESRTQCGL